MTMANVNMNPNINQHMYPSYMPYSSYASYYTAWNHNSFNPVVRGNLVHVNPAFLQPPPTQVAHPGPQKVIVNPRFFPQVHCSNVQQSHADNAPKPNSRAVTTEKVPEKSVKVVANPKEHAQKPTQEPPQRIVLLPSEKTKPQPEQSRFKIKTNLKVVNVPNVPTNSLRPVTSKISQEMSARTPPQNSSKRLVVAVNTKPSPIGANNRVVKLSPKLSPRLKVLQANLKNKYKWKKSESPLKPLILKNAYKLVRKSSPAKSVRLSLSLKIPPFNGLMILTPPKLASTPVETGGVNTRFKLDNRREEKKKALKPSSPRGLLTKFLKSKYKIVRNKLSKPCGSPVIRASHTSITRSFSNFNTFNKSLLNRSKLQVVIKKAVKTPKKAKAAPKTKKSNRYYDNDLKAKSEEDSIGDVEIVANSCGPAPRAPIGNLPSFITL